MDYTAHYNRLIERARYRVIEGYSERHHVLPRCMGGGNEPWNIVSLTAEEHYVSHQLLVKMYPQQGGLVHAACFMSKRATGNKAYGWLRRRNAIVLSNALRGKKRPPEVGLKISITHKLRGNKPKDTPEIRAKMAATLRGMPKSAEHVAKVAAAQRGVKRKPCSQEKKDRLAISMLGNTYGIGYRHTPEALEKIAAASRRQGRWSMPQETRDKIAATLRARNAV